MFFPSVLCLWVAAAIVRIGPIYHEFWNQRKVLAEFIRKSQLDIRKSDEEREAREKNMLAPRAPAADNGNANLP